MRKQYRHWAYPILCAVTVATLAASCNGAVKLGSSAVHELQSVGKNASEVSLGAEELANQSARYRVRPEVMTAVAENVDSQPGWSDPLEAVSNLYRQSKDAAMAQLAVSVGCDGLTGQLTSQSQIIKSLGGAVQGLGPNRAKNFIDSTKDLNEKLVTIARGGNDQDKAAAAWLCYTYQNAP